MPENLDRTTTPDDVQRGLHPRSIAIVGASGRADSLNARPLRYLQEHGFEGSLHPVNPSYDELAGLTCHPSLEAIGQQVDLVLVLVPAAQAVDVVRQAGRVGSAMAVVFGSGFAEVGVDGKRLQAELVAAGREAGVRILGPNCQGIIYGPSGMAATFTAAADRPMTGRSGVAYVGQSGAVGGSVLDLATEMGLALTAWVSTGNQADVDLVEIAESLVADESIDVIMMYAEAINDGAAFTRLASAARAGNTSLVVLLSGRSAAGRRAAASHTGSMIGDDIGMTLTASRHGVVMVDDIDELLAVGASLRSGPRSSGRRIAVITTSGGAGSLAADHCALHGLDLPELSAGTQERLSSLVPDFGSLANPVDVTAQLFNREGSAQALGSVCRIVAEDPDVDAIAVVLTMVTGDLGADLAADLSATSASVDVPVFVAWLAGRDQTQQGRAVFRAAGMPVFSSVGDMTRAMGLLAETPPGADVIDAAPTAGVHDLLLGCAAGTVSPDEVLTALGVHQPGARLTVTPDETATAVYELGGLAAVKIHSTMLAHKSDIGGVRLGVTPDDARAVHHELATVAHDHQLRGFSGLLVQEMLPAGPELIVGLTSRSDGFGPVLTVGIGGVRTEIYGDIASDLAPVSAARAEELLRSLRGWQILDGFRGLPTADVAAAAEAVAAASHALDGWGGDPIELEINPLIVAEKGHGAHAVDLLVTVAAAATAAPSSTTTTQK